MITEQLAIALGFKLTDLSVCDSFVHDVPFYEYIEIPHIFLTEWNLKDERPYNNGLCCLFYSYKGISNYNVLSLTVVNNKTLFEVAIASFIEEIKNAQ